MSLLIYSDKSSQRLKYILEFIFGTLIPCEYKLTQSFDDLLHFEGAKINYSQKEPYDNLINICPIGLLEETDIREQNLAYFEWQSVPAIFKTVSHKIPFDLFSATFYLVTRYEEYLSNELDEFERFPHAESAAFKYNFLNRPLIDEWSLRLKEVLLAQFPRLIFQKKEFTFLPTYDIDIAYSYKHKGLLRNIGGAIKDLSKGNFSALKNRLLVHLNKRQDPFDSFDYLNGLHKKYKLSPIYFFLLGSGSKYDKNISVKNTAFRNLIKQITQKYHVGIHPSYRSNIDTETLNKEVQILNKIAHIQTTKSRQHYIKFSLPQTFQNLIEQGITEDYSMGYGSINGFRASTSNSFKWFNLSKNECTNLVIHPFCFMECNSFFEQKQTIAKTQIETKELVQAVKKVNGTFISVWHNFSLGTDPLWRDWKKLYQYQIEYIQKKQH